MQRLILPFVMQLICINMVNNIFAYCRAYVLFQEFARVIIVAVSGAKKDLTMMMFL